MKTTRTRQITLSYEPLVMTSTHPFGISYGTSEKTYNVLVKLEFDGLTGMGEAAPVEYHNENTATVNAVLETFKNEELLGDDPFAIQEISRRMDRSLAGNASAKAAIEMALHDLCGKILNTPTYKMLGLSNLEAPITDFTIGIADIEMIEKKAREAVDAGYKILKVKQGTTFDRDIINRVRKVAPDMPLRVDANGGWTPKKAIEMSHFLHANGVQFIEQPLPKNAHYEDWKLVRDNSPIPIYADESIARSVDVAKLAGAIDGVVVKLAKTGGLIEALKVIHAARAHSMQIMFGCMLESSLGVTAAVHLASLVDHLDLDGALLLSDDPYLGAQYENGFMRLSDRPGLGVIPR